MVAKVLSQESKDEYPFDQNFMVTDDDHLLHYLDEGNKDHHAIIMVHGNPTWSFYYRNLVKDLKSQYRVIVPDHLGCGFSDKPQDYDYTLKNHIKNLTKLINELLDQGRSFDLVVHDWGGAIGMGTALNFPKRIRKTVILNTAAFTSTRIPKRINLCKLPLIGEQLVRHFNAFAYPATKMAVTKPLKDHIKKGYLLPYNNYKNRIATARFVRDIPMKESHVSWDTLKNIENNLHTIDGEKMILWGGKDFCFNMDFYERWLKIYPQARTFLFSDGGHYILEDKEKDAVEKIGHFIRS
jgi:pimeloyl-ACP methyl ester carboxylesterase